MPPGGPEDVRPPVVVATIPGALEMVTDLETDIRFDFDERISERVPGGALETAISVSPTAGEYRVQHGRQSLTLKMEGGLRPGLVYRVTLNAAVSDMFGNTITDPFELIFSTGAEPVPTTLAGEVWDRITGRPVSQAALVAIGSDSLVHRSTADRAGIFAFRYLPGGGFDVTAFQDQNRDGEPDSTEVQGLKPLSIAVGDTVLLDLPILTPDTSAANLTGTEVLDSTTVILLFDDFLDYEQGTAGIDVTISSDSADAPGIVELMHETAYIAWVEEVEDSLAILDSIEAEELATVATAEARAAADRAAAMDSTVSDSTLASDSALEVAPTEPLASDGIVVSTDTAGPADTVVVAQVGAGAPGERPQALTPRSRPPTLPRLEGSTAGPTADGRRVLPGRRIIARVDAPIPFETEFTVTVSGVVNIFGLAGGEGELALLREVVIDSVAAVDSLVSADSIPAADSIATADTGLVIDTGTVALAGREGRR